MSYYWDRLGTQFCRNMQVEWKLKYEAKVWIEDLKNIIILPFYPQRAMAQQSMSKEMRIKRKKAFKTTWNKGAL